MEQLTEIPEFVRSLPELDLPIVGARGWTMESGGRQIVFVEFDRDVEVPEHSHDEQWEIPLSGEVTLHMGGESTVYRPGTSFHIPAGVPHAGSVRAGYKAMIIFNESGRYPVKK